MTQPLIIQTGTTITLQPSQEFSVGLYQLALIGTLTRYPDVDPVIEVFSVEVAGCNSQLVSDKVTAEVIAINSWFTADVGTSFMPAVNQLVQEPDCNFGYQYELFYEPVVGAGMYTVPPGVTFNPSTDAVFIEKCVTEANIQDDGECVQKPFRIEYPLVLRATLDDGTRGTPEQQSVDIPIMAVLEDPCASN